MMIVINSKTVLSCASKGFAGRFVTELQLARLETTERGARERLAARNFRQSGNAMQKSANAPPLSFLLRFVFIHSESQLFNARQARNTH